MEQLTALLEKFGLQADTIILIAGLVYLFVEWSKNRLPTAWFGEWRTQVWAVGYAAGLSVLLLYPNIPGMIVAAVLAWLLPDSFHQARFTERKAIDAKVMKAKLEAIAKMKSDQEAFKAGQPPARHLNT